LLSAAKHIDIDVAFAELQPDPSQPDLLQKAQVVFGDAPGRQPVAQFEVACARFIDARRFPILPQ